MGLSDEQLIVTEWVAFTFATISLICSLLTLFLIYKMKAWNGYLLLITSMTCFQVLYDINYMLGVYPSFAACASWQFLHILGGLSVTIWTNIISFIVMYVVRKIRSFNIYSNYKYFCVIAVLFPFIVAILQVVVVKPASANDDDKPYNYCTTDDSELSNAVSGIYYWGRLVSIIFNFVVFFYTSYRVSQMALAHAPRHNSNSRAISFQSAENSESSKKSQIVSETQTLAVYSLVQRMKYYPLAQALCRSGAAWNEFDDYRYQTYASNMMASIASPSTGILYFIIFLIMQPKAWETLRCLITSRSINEEPSVNVSYFTKENFQQFNEEDLESIIDENLDSERLRNLSVDSVGGIQSISSTKVNVDNPLRKFSEGYDL